jgi:hypothetical protein
MRLQRVTVESAHVSVSLDDEVMEPDPSRPGTLRINADKLVRAAIAMRRLESTVWTSEANPEITMHPEQTDPKLG